MKQSTNCPNTGNKTYENRQTVTLFLTVRFLFQINSHRFRFSLIQNV